MTKQIGLRTLMAALGGLAFAVTAPAALAQDGAARQIMIGVGAQSQPSYPGSAEQALGVFPDFLTWQDGEPIPAKAPDQGGSFPLVGRTGGFAIGPVFTPAPQRSASDLPGMPAVKFGIEAGVFAETFVAAPLRLRAELRQGIGAHHARTGNLGADLVLRGRNKGFIATIGPRLRWGDAKYNQAYFGVTTPVPGYAAYQPGSGIYAVGAVAGVHMPLGRAWGLFGYAGFDRLSGDAARSPIVTNGSRNQGSAGLALTYRFSI